MSAQRATKGTALVDAGEALARAEGLDGVTVRRIAAACGVSAAAVYRHFPSGDHLIAAVAQRAREIMARDMFARLSSAAGRPPIDRLREVGEAYIAFALAEPRLFSLVSMPMTTPPDRIDDPNAADLVRDIVLELEPPGVVDEQRVASRMMLAQASAHGLAVILRASNSLPGCSTAWAWGSRPEGRAASIPSAPLFCVTGFEAPAVVTKRRMLGMRRRFVTTTRTDVGGSAA